jgi:hypothetical protein
VGQSHLAHDEGDGTVAARADLPSHRRLGTGEGPKPSDIPRSGALGLSRMTRDCHVRWAPCGASAHPRFSRETLEGGVWATSLPAVERPTGPEHAGRRARLPEGAVRQVVFDPADRVKAKLPESQSPVVKVSTRRKERLTTAADPCDGMNREVVAPSRGGHWPVRSSKGMSGAPTSASDVC